jgi:penicillin-binding protein 1A
MAALAGYVAVQYRSVCGSPCLDLHRVVSEEPAAASIVTDRNGVEIARFFYEDRRPLRLEEIPETLRSAVLATEDARFYQHHGIDYVRVGGAMLKNVLLRRTAQGFSTITMQLARTTYPELLPVTEKTLRRKLAEVRVAREIEHALTKRQILQRYLNTVYLGQGAYGVESAARRYFGKPVTKLTLAEAALIAGLPRAPSRDNPVVNPTRALERRSVVLNRMLDEGMITSRAADSARAEPLHLSALASRDTTIDPPVLAADSSQDLVADDNALFNAGLATRTPDGTLAPFFVEAIRQQLSATLGRDLYRGGYRIHTTLDVRVQAAAERALAAQLASIERGDLGPRGRPTPGGPRLEGAVVVMDGRTGDILALVGGRDFRQSRFNRVTQAVRQPGSAFKVITLAAAIEQGWSADRMISDDSIPITLGDGTTWSPGNFDAGHGGGMVSLQTMITQSLNRAATRLAFAVTLDSVISMGRRLGLTTDLPRVPSLALGVGGVRMLEMVSAFSPMTRSDGHRSLPRWVIGLTDRHLAHTKVNPARDTVALAPEDVAKWRAMLENVVDYGTGGPVRRAGYIGPAAGKTGTTSNASDLWFIGATPNLVAGVWVGYDTPREVLPGVNGTGGRASGPVWGALMRALGDSLTGTAWPEVIPDWKEPEEPPSVR